MCVAVCVVVAAPGVAAASTVNGSITMIGAQGDYISGGSQYLFDAPGANAMSGNAGTVAVNTPSPVGAAFGYTMDFAAPTGGQLSVGAYDNAERYPFESAGHPGLDISGDGRGCNQDFGWFIIKDIHLDGGGTVERRSAPFLARLRIEHMRLTETRRKRLHPIRMLVQQKPEIGPRAVRR